MVLPEKPSEKIECRRRVKGLINEAGKKSWTLMKRRKNEIRRKNETEKVNQDDGCSGRVLVLREEGGKKRKREVEEGPQNGANSGEKGGIPKRKSARGRPRGCLWKHLEKDEKIGPPPLIGPDTEEKGGVQTDQEIDDAEDVTHEQGEAHVLKEPGIKKETAEIDSVIQSSETAEAILQGGETNEVESIERGQEVIVLSSDDEQPRKVKRAVKRQVIDLESEDERSFSQAEESKADFDYFGL